MNIGVALPLPADVLGDDADGLRAFVDRVDGLGFEHLAVHDHVVGIDPAAVTRPAVRYSHESRFHEPLTTLAWVAAISTRLRLMTTVLISPQRQTALLAKQAVEVAVLSGGRLSLGVGVGVNNYEYDALGVDFRHRGRILDEQLDVLRGLWSGQPQTRVGEGFKLSGAAVAPAPPAPIPLLIGGSSEAAIRRAARSGDGLLLMTSDQQLVEAVAKMHRALDEAGRVRAGFALHGFIEVVTGDAPDWIERIERAHAAGLTGVSLMTGHPSQPPLGGLGLHLDRLGEVAAALADHGLTAD